MAGGGDLKKTENDPSHMLACMWWKGWAIGADCNVMWAVNLEV